MKGVIIAQKKWICHIPQNVEKEESPWNGHKEKSLCAKSNRKPGPKKSKTDDFDEAKMSDLSLCFSWRVFGLRLTHLTHSFPSQGDLSLEFSRTSLPRVWPRSLILPLIGWCHYRIDTHLNEVRKLNSFRGWKLWVCFYPSLPLLKQINSVCSSFGFWWNLARIFFKY